MDVSLFSTSKIPPQVSTALIYFFNLGSGFGIYHRRVKHKHSSPFASTNAKLTGMKIVAVAAMSLNGFITRGKEPGTAFTSAADKAWFAGTMKSFPVKIMGRCTFEASRHMILDLVEKQPGQLRIVLTGRPSAYNAISRRGRLEFMKATPREVLRILEQHGHAEKPVAILGGGRVYAGFLRADLLDEFWITLEPQFFGTGTPLLKGAFTKRLQLLEVNHLSPSTLLLKYSAKPKS